MSGTALTNPDFAKFIEAFAAHGEIVETTEQLVPAVKRALASGKPAVVEVRTNPEQVTNRATIADLRAQANKAARHGSGSAGRRPRVRQRRRRGAPGRVR